MIYTNRIQETLNRILEVFKSGDIPKAISFAAFPPFNVPASKWSFLNNIILWANKTNDARGYRQWLEVGRHVKKGSQAIYILAPRIKKDEEDETLIGFLGIPVFKVEDTEGEPLNYEQAVPNFPLMDRAKEWGLNVSAVEGNSRFWGAYNGTDIKLATADEIVFFHELSHHAHKLIKGELTPGQDWKQEIVAELSAEALCHLVGIKKETIGTTYKYIVGYAEEAKLSPVKACLEVLHEVERVVKLILWEKTDQLTLEEV